VSFLMSIDALGCIRVSEKKGKELTGLWHILEINANYSKTVRHLGKNFYGTLLEFRDLASLCKCSLRSMALLYRSASEMLLKSCKEYVKKFNNLKTMLRTI
jgi:hypothetical protein